MLAIEELYFNIKRFLPKRLVKVLDKRIIRYQKVTPNEEKKWPLLNDFYFELWGGCRYDRNDIIVRVIDPPKVFMGQLCIIIVRACVKRNLDSQYFLNSCIL